MREKTPAIHQILGVHPGIKHVVEENVLGHIPAVGGALPQAQGVTDFDAGQGSLRLKDPGDSMVRGALYMLTPWMEADTCFLGVRA